MAITHAPKPLMQSGSAWETGAIGESSVLNDGTLYRCWYHGGWANASAAIGLRTCPISVDATVPTNWTTYAGNPVLGQGGSSIAGTAMRPEAHWDGTNLWMAYSNGTDLYLSQSTDGFVGQSWGTPSKIVDHTAISGATSLQNVTIWQAGTSDWGMLLEYFRSGFSWSIAYLTATAINGTWTIQLAPLSTLAISGYTGYSGPNFFGKIDGFDRILYHVDSGATSDQWFASSNDDQTWTPSAAAVIIHDGSTYEKDQVGDACLIADPTFSRLLVFHSGTDNTAQHSYINVSIYNGSAADFARYYAAGAIAYHYQWTRDGIDIAGATSSTYVTQAADLGHAIGCKVRAANAAGAVTQASSNTVTAIAAASTPGYRFAFA